MTRVVRNEIIMKHGILKELSDEKFKQANWANGTYIKFNSEKRIYSNILLLLKVIPGAYVRSLVTPTNV